MHAGGSKSLVQGTARLRGPSTISLLHVQIGLPGALKCAVIGGIDSSKKIDIWLLKHGRKNVHTTMISQLITC